MNLTILGFSVGDGLFEGGLFLWEIVMLWARSFAAETLIRNPETWVVQLRK